MLGSGSKGRKGKNIPPSVFTNNKTTYNKYQKENKQFVVIKSGGNGI
jgi:hypothetical protein